MTNERHCRQHGLLLLRKKTGVTSFDALKEVKQAFGTGKVGHTGTLDKFASGLLLVLVGRAVKLAPLFSGYDKEYIATIRFGEETDTLDPEGTVIAQGRVPSRDEVEAVLPRFRGNILQAPPVYSAIHINGQRAHELARDGKNPAMKERPITIYKLEIHSWTPPEAVIQVKCSAGTYIRSLARDIALAAGSRASLSVLTRTKVGAFDLENAAGEGNLVNNLRSLDRDLFRFLALPFFVLDDRAAEGFVHGRSLEDLLPSNFETENYGATQGYDMNSSAAGVFRKTAGGDSDVLLGVLERRNNKWCYGHVFANN